MSLYSRACGIRIGKSVNLYVGYFTALSVVKLYSVERYDNKQMVIGKDLEESVRGLIKVLPQHLQEG
jgi:hypothetical protein